MVVSVIKLVRYSLNYEMTFWLKCLWNMSVINLHGYVIVHLFAVTGLGGEQRQFSQVLLIVSTVVLNL